MKSGFVRAQDFSSYDQVPFFRKRWFAVLSMFVFAPAVIIIAVTGNLYASTKNGVQMYTPSAKRGVIFGAAFMIFLGLQRLFLGT
jgi:hypothetical protein